MDRKKVSLAVLSIAIGSLAVAYVAASSQILNTPLYTFRMEQQSSEMNFLPTEMNTFTYTAERGCNLTYGVVGWCGVNPLSTSPASTCNPSCFDTCEDTCEWTCFDTCGRTCPSTCDDPTCVLFTCGITHWETCPSTCDDPTCVFTCESTHWETCNPCLP